MGSEGVEKAERYSSGGVAVGVIGLAIVAIALGYGVLVDDARFAPWAFPLFLLCGVLTWMVLIRPAVLLHDDAVELRNILESRWVPLARITQVEVKQVTILHVDDERYVGAGFGRTRRRVRRDGLVGPAALDAFAASAQEGQRAKVSLGGLLEERLRRRSADARSRAGEPGEVRREWAWPPIAVVGVLGLATVVLALAG